MDVSVDTPNAYINVNPSVLHGSGYIHLNLMSKTLSGQLDLCFGFLGTIGKVKTLEVQRVKVGANKTLNYFWEPVKLEFTNTKFSFERVNDWFTMDLEVNKNQNYYFRLWLDVSPEIGYNRHEYYVGFKPSNQTFQEAVLSNNFHFLDPWIDSGWRYRKSLLINDATGAGTNYQIKINVHYGSGSDSGENVYLNEECQTDFDDIRFTDNDQTTLLDYWLESKTDSDEAIVWVEVQDSLSVDDATIYLYYGNLDASSVSNGDNTFLFFDDFEGVSLDYTVWDDNGGNTVSDSIVYMQNPNASAVWIRTDNNVFDVDQALRAYWKPFGANNFYGSLKTGEQTRFQHIGSGYKMQTNSYDGSWESSNLGSSVYDWGLYEIWRVSNSYIEFWLDDVNVDTNNVQIPDDDHDVWFYTWNVANNKLNVDWVLVRKLVDPEPVLGAWGSIESEYYLTFYSNSTFLNQFRVNNVSISNGTNIYAYENQTFELSAIPRNASWFFLNFTWIGGFSNLNNYTVTVTENNTIWCNFVDPPFGKPGEEAPGVNIPVLFGGFIFIMGLIAFTLYVSRKRNRGG